MKLYAFIMQCFYTDLLYFGLVFRLIFSQDGMTTSMSVIFKCIERYKRQT